MYRRWNERRDIDRRRDDGWSARGSNEDDDCRKECGPAMNEWHAGPKVGYIRALTPADRPCDVFLSFIIRRAAGRQTLPVDVRAGRPADGQMDGMLDERVAGALSARRAI